MPDLPIRRMVIYKHGVGYFERRGAASGTSLRLSFPREAMDDVLKSLVALDLGGGQVLGVDFETPEDRAAKVSRGSIHLSDSRSLLDLLRDLRGRRVRLAVRLPYARGRAALAEESAGETDSTIEGLVVGVDFEEEAALDDPVVSIYQPDQRMIRSLPVRAIRHLEVLDDQAAEDLAYFLNAAQSEEDRRSATLRLSDGDHDLLVGYIAPAPAWRVSYRALFESAPDGSADTLLLQGWGLFDNQLDEDLEQVTLTLVAGMPVSFRYRLYEPHTPERPLVADEERTVAAPVAFDAMMLGAPMEEPPMPAMAAPAGMMRKMAVYEDAEERFSVDTVESSTVPVSVGEERGALFQYRVAHPVSVGRGQSAMVPIVGKRLGGRKELLYNQRKLPRHPVASLRTRNETGLTLERGPVTVTEDGDYAGEAVLPFTRDGAELIVSYAVELGITVSEEYSSERQIGRINVRNEYLLIQEWDIQRTLYRLKSTLAKEATVLVEQQIEPGYELTETPDPLEQSQGVARWPVICPAGSEVTFIVQRRQQVSRHERVRGLNARQLREFLGQRYLDEATYQGLAGVLEIYGRIDERQRRLQQIEQERQKIYKRQQQTQGSLGPLGREGEEGALRSRYVALLNELENQLASLAEEEQRVRVEIERLESEAASTLAVLAAR